MFIGEHALFGPARTLAFLSADLLDAGAFGIDVTLLERFDLVEQKAPGEETIESLLARGLAFDLEAGGTMHQHHAGGRLVDVLAAVAAGTDKRLVDVGLPHAQRGHALRKLAFLFRTDGECAHNASVTGGRFLDKGRQSCYVDSEIWNKVCQPSWLACPPRWAESPVPDRVAALTS
jgi:hypothetical protein